MVSFIVRRLLLYVPMAVVAFTMVFLLTRALPANPARLIAGPLATPETLAKITRDLGLDKPLATQFVDYLTGAIRGDLGRSWYTGNAVVEDLARRLPATLELISISLILALILGISAGVLVALRPRGIIDRLTQVYGLFAGALPDFWLALVLVFFFYVTLHVAPAPIGRLGPALTTPPVVTGFLTIDSVLAGDGAAFLSAVSHLLLPVATLVFVYAGPIIKMTRSTMEQVLEAGYISHARAAGVSERQVIRYALRTALPPVVTIAGVIYGYLFGGAVLVESVFGWGGVGQYAVQSIRLSDLQAIQGFVIVAALFSLTLYLVIDVVHGLLDPRLRVGHRR